MNKPLIWMPLLDVRTCGEALFNWKAQRFLKSHGGYGHILALHGGYGSSLEVLSPEANLPWYCGHPQALGDDIPAASMTLELSLPLLPNNPLLGQISAWQNAGLLHRLVLTRQKDAPLEETIASLETLLALTPAPLWLDVASFGFHAASYLMARNPELQLSGLADQEVLHLARLAELLERPLVMADLSPKRPKPISPLPYYRDEQDPVRVLKTLPYWNSTR